jgi:hypothetical protein
MRRTIAAIVAGLAAAGCGALAEEATEGAIEGAIESEGGGDVSVELDADGDGARFEIEGADGTESFSVGSTEVPEELTIPLFEGYEVVGSSTASAAEGGYITLNVQYPADSVSNVVLFYNGYFEDDPSVNAFETSNDDLSSWSWSAADGSTQVTITYTPGQPSADVIVIEASIGSG